MDDMRKTLYDLTETARSLHQSERSMTLESVEVVGRLDALNAAVNFGISSEKFAVKIGLTPSTYWRRVQVARALRRFPVLRDLLLSGETEVSHLALVAPKITPANADLITEGIRGKARRDVAAFLSRVLPDGRLSADEGRVEIKFDLTVSQLKKVDRAREILSANGKVPSTVEVFMKAVDDLLSMDTVARLDREVPDDAIAVRFDEVDGTDVAAGLPDR